MAICATSLLTFAMEVDETDSAPEEAGAQTDWTQQESEILRLI